MSIEAMKMALEALELLAKWEHPASNITTKTGRIYPQRVAENAAISLRATLEQPEQEPVAWMVYTLDGKSVCVTDNPIDFTHEHRALPLYTTPQPQREWVGLTDEEIADIYIKWDKTSGVSMADFARAIEAKLKEKND